MNDSEREAEFARREAELTRRESELTAREERLQRFSEELAARALNQPCSDTPYEQTRRNLWVGVVQRMFPGKTEAAIEAANNVLKAFDETFTAR
jgi:hypothetical protein